LRISGGNANFKVNGRSYAEATAYAYAVAYATAIVDASVCDKCSAAAKFVASSWQSLILKAVAEAEVDLKGAANGGKVEDHVNAFVKSVAEATVTAYVKVCTC
jgi:hypothetical protein